MANFSNPRWSASASTSPEQSVSLRLRLRIGEAIAGPIDADHLDARHVEEARLEARARPAVEIEHRKRRVRSELREAQPPSALELQALHGAGVRAIRLAARKAEGKVGVTSTHRSRKMCDARAATQGKVW